MNEEKILVSIRHLTASSDSRVLLKRVNMDIFQGDLLGIAGESGSGKTMMIRALLNIPPDGVSCKADKMEIFGTDCTRITDAAWRHEVGSHIGFVPQNTMFYLHPMMKIRKQITDSFVTYGRGNRQEGLARAEQLLRQVGFDDPVRILNSYAWELSGGMRQRVNIAMALMTGPQILIADEPTTALDAAIQRQIMDLFMKISQETGIAMVLISHDLGMLRQYSKRTMVMYAGRMVEIGSTKTVFEHPAHPYTRALMRVVPSMKIGPNDRLHEIPGYVPDSGRETDLCIFRDRCPQCSEACQGQVHTINLGDGHFCLCHKAGGRA